MTHTSHAPSCVDMHYRLQLSMRHTQCHECMAMQGERDELYERFEASIYEVAQKSGLKGALLERRLEAMSEQLEMKDAQLAEVLTAANLEPSALQVSLRHPVTVWAYAYPCRQWAMLTGQCCFTVTEPMCLCYHMRVLQAINHRLDEVLNSKNSIIRALQYDVAKVSKAHNDLIRVYEAKLAEFGIPVEELGFRPLVTNTSTGPAGLVVGA